jgi:hypothetical protein
MGESNWVDKLCVSKYPVATSSFNQQVLLLDELGKIKSGHYESLIIPCRLLFEQDKTAYSALKRKLPAITFCGEFKGAHKKENILTYNNIVIIDIDHIAKDRIHSLKQRLFSDKYVFAIWISPSGNGLKVLFRVESNSTMHKFMFDKIADHLQAMYDIEADISGSDICRLCFISHDEDLLLKRDADFFPFSEDEWLMSLLPVSKKKNDLPGPKLETKVEELYAISEKVLFFGTEGKNKVDHREMVKKIIIYLKKNKKSITGTYQLWLKVGLAISNSFTYPIGKEVFLQLCRLDGPMHDEYKSEMLLEHCYRKRKANEVNFGTIVYLAQQQGYIVNKKAGTGNSLAGIDVSHLERE